jgi:hypothetical protein
MARLTTKELMEIVKQRGLRIVIVDGQLIIKKPVGNENVTDELVRVLKRRKEQIIAFLKSEGQP